jgi:hypothetical protein
VRAAKRRFTLEAHDGDCEDGGTMYFLVDELGKPVASCPWPQPLERLAAERNGSVARTSTQWGQETLT